MERGKRILIILGIIVVIICVIGGVYVWMNQDNQEETITEYTPQEEISEEQMRQTIVTLYFKTKEELSTTNSINVDKQTDTEIKLVPEARLTDVKKLLENPYEEIITMLMQGPKNEQLKSTIPEGTKLNKIEKKEDTLIIDFSKEFVENHVGGEKEEKLTIQSIVNTVTELTEINHIKIVIDGEENVSFKDQAIKFNKEFSRSDF